MTEKKPGSMKLERKSTTRAKTAAERAEAIKAGEAKPAPAAPELVKLSGTPKSYRMSDRGHKLAVLAVNEATARGERATLGSKLEEALIKVYGHLDQD